MAESGSMVQLKEGIDFITQGSEAMGSKAQCVAASGSITQGAASAGPRAQRPSISCPARTVAHGGPWAVAGCLAGTGLHTGCKAPDRLIAATLKRGAQMAGAGRAAISAVDQVAGVGRATRGA